MALQSAEDTLRSLAVLYVCLNWEKFQNFAVQPDGTPFGSAKMYAKNMGKKYVFGCNAKIHALAEIFNVAVLITQVLWNSI